MWRVKGLYVWRMYYKHINLISLFYVVFPVTINLFLLPVNFLWPFGWPRPLLVCLWWCYWPFVGASLMGHVSHYPCYVDAGNWAVFASDFLCERASWGWHRGSQAIWILHQNSGSGNGAEMNPTPTLSILLHSLWTVSKHNRKDAALSSLMFIRLFPARCVFSRWSNRWI